LKVRRIIVSIAILTLFGLTGAKVGALWSKPQVVSLPSQPSLSSFKKTTALQQHSFDAQTQHQLERLNNRLQRDPNDFEASLLMGLLLFQAGQLDDAISELQQLSQRAPKFQLAHLILGDFLLARFDQVDAIGASGLLKNVGSGQEQRLVQLQREAQARLQGYLSLVDGTEVPEPLLTLGNHTKYALVVDKSKNRLYVFKNVGSGLPPKLVDDFYVVLGKKRGNKLHEGDFKTPSGIYFVTSYLPDEKLPPLYGRGAFPVNYPNEYDRRLQRTGTGIWLHGTDKSLYSRPPLDSEGCVVLTNEEFSRIRQYIEIGRTPVVISETVAWISNRRWLDQNIEIQAALETWRQNWEKADLQAYLQMYSDEFWSKNYNKNRWGVYKSRVFSGKKYQKIDLSDISILNYPDDDRSQPMVVANFVQHYQSNNFTGNLHKRLYMVKEQGSWKILYEGRQ
jgi:murein L,D-transpeptidase YafK